MAGLELSENFDINDLYIPWHNHLQSLTQPSKGVHYLGYFGGFGEVYAKHRIWAWKQQSVPVAQWGHNIIRSLDFQERAIDATLAKLENCVVLSTTPTYFSQYQSACVLKSKGFELLEGRCYRHPNYDKKSTYAVEHPGVPDCYLHWEHIWWKVIGKPTEIGAPANYDQLNNCGVDSGTGAAYVKDHDEGWRKQFLAVAWLPRGEPFPQGWKRFFSAQDYKLGVNFDLIEKRGSKVQECPHNFDIKIFDGWEPDFAKWTPA